MKTLKLSNIFMNLSIFLLSLFLFSCSSLQDSSPSYLNTDLGIEKRVDDLLKRMTLEEKVGQMCQYYDLQKILEAEKRFTAEELKGSHQYAIYEGLRSSDIIEMIKEGKIGSFLQLSTPESANLMQSYALQSRLKIPLIIGVDAAHGHSMATGATVYPSPISLSSSFNLELVEAIGKQTAKEMRVFGAHWTFAPNIDIVRDPRWGRTGETYGEDTYLISEMGVAMVKGLQGGDSFNKDESVLACIKHMIGGGEPMNGLNASPTDMSERTLREVHLPPYKAAVEAGAMSVMMAHNEVNGVPCHMNSYFMKDILRDEYKFDGIITSDWMDVERIHDLHFIAETAEEAYFLGALNGIETHMHGPGFFESITKAVNEKRMDIAVVDIAVRRLLKAKFQLGLFENPYVPEDNYKTNIFTDEHKETALQAARECIVLLKNDGILPLKNSNYKSVFVVGPNTNDHKTMGDWSLTQPEENIITVLEGIQAEFGEQLKISTMSSPENAVSEAPNDYYAEMLKNAGKNDLIIVVAGENPLRKTSGRTCGESQDRADINLPGYQNTMVEKLIATGKPIILVLVNGRPLGLEYIYNNVNAVVESWEPGAFGGQAIAEIIAGKVNPSGKLPITFPRTAGHIKTYYNYKPSSYFIRNYVGAAASPLYEFGFGLSYTKFDFSEPVLSSGEMSRDGSAKLTVNVKNSGEFEGKEVVQLYIRDDFSSVTRPVKELKAFEKINLKAGESKDITFDITPEMLKFFDKDFNFIVEPGTFTLMVGNSSSDKNLKKVILTVI